MSLDTELLHCFLDEAEDLLQQWEAICLELSKNQTEDLWNQLFRVAHNLKGTSRSVGLDEIGGFVHRVEDGITLGKLGKTKVDKVYFQKLFKAHEVLLDWSKRARQDSAAGLHAEAFEFFEEDSRSEVSNDTQEEVLEKKSIVQDASVEEELIVPTQETKSEELVSKVPASVAATSTQKVGIHETLRVSAKKLDELIQMIGELSIHQNIAAFQSNLNPNKSIEAQFLVKKITKELYEKALTLRMQPIQSVFQRLERTIQDLATSQSKEIEVVLEGCEVELDKTVCEKILDPLTHMVRNSVDHGIEDLEGRLDASKDSKGKILLSAIQESGFVTIKVQDDGKGLSQDRILQKAKEKGLVQEGAKLNESEVYRLIFLPGFSTAEKVTDVSGRGVGMDVVMKSVESLKGRIHVSSEKGHGTVFSIQLPTSLSLIESIPVTLEDDQYCVPLDLVEEVVKVKKDILQDQKIKIRDQVLPLVKLHSFFRKRDNKISESTSDHGYALIVSKQTKRIAFFVDEIGEQNQIVVRALGDKLKNVFGLAGATILSNGEPGLILDLDAISKVYLEKFDRKEERRVS